MPHDESHAMFDAACLRRLRAQALRLSRHSADVDDLVQDVLVAAIIAGRSDAPWLAGTLRRQAALAARGASRRRRRERVAGAAQAALAAREVVSNPSMLGLPPMPPAARRVARLALHGLSADDIRWLLQISPQAFRQRLVSIRRAVAASSEDVRDALRAFAADPVPSRHGVPGGMVPARRVLKAALRGAVLGSHDPDGHLLVIRSGAHVPYVDGNSSLHPSQ